MFLRLLPLFVAPVLLVGCGHLGLDYHEMSDSSGDGSVGGNLDPGGSGGTDLGGGTGGAAGGTNGMEATGGDPSSSFGGALVGDFLVDAGFESEGEIDGKTSTEGSATLELSNEQSHSGDSSLKLTQGGPGEGALVHYEFPPVTEADLYFRGWVYIPEGTVNGRLKLLGLVGDTEILDVNLLPGGIVDIYIHESGDRQTSQQDVQPYGEWFCLQLHHSVHPTAGFAEVHVNGISSGKTDIQDTQGDVGIIGLDLGLPWTEEAQTGGVVYWDDVVVDTKPVACE